jgi:transaldolase
MHYFKRVTAETKTRFWVNNPTLEQAKKAIEEGAVGCTTNPSYISKLLKSEEDNNFVIETIDQLLAEGKSNGEVASELQRRAVLRLSNEFLPMYKNSNGLEGLVTIQSDPFEEEIIDLIIHDGIKNRSIAENIVIKIPVTVPGIEAIRYFVENDIPTMATEVMTLSQVVSICEAYINASEETKKNPIFYVTHITGILDDFFRNEIREKKISLSDEAIKYAGLTIAKKEYELIKSKNYPVRMIGGGARKNEDFTDLVGGDLSITINWNGTGESLLEKDMPITSLIDSIPSETVVKEMIDTIPGFKEAYFVDNLKEKDYFNYGGVALFRESFRKGWNIMLALIEERRAI